MSLSTTPAKDQTVARKNFKVLPVQVVLVDFFLVVLGSPITNHSNLGAGYGTDVPNTSSRRGGYGRVFAQEAH